MKGYRALVASALAFSLMTVCVKQLDGRLPIAEVVLARAVISIVITRIMIKRAVISPWGINKRLLLCRGLLGTGALFCVFKALELLPLASATIIQYTYPTFTVLGSWLLLGEKLKRQIILAVLIGWIGIALVIRPTLASNSLQEFSILPLLIAVSGSLLTALAYITVRKLSKEEHKLVIVYYFPLVSIPLTIPFILRYGVWPLGIEWIWLLGVGLLTQLGQIWITEGLTQLPASQATSINYTQVAFSAVWGVLIFKEALEISTLIGSIFILVATLISIKSVKTH